MARLILSVGIVLSFGIACIRTADISEFSNSKGENVNKNAEIMNKGRSFLEILGEFIPGPAKYLIPLLHLNIRYYLFTPKNLAEKYNLKSTNGSLTDSPFDSKLQTKFIIPGYRVVLEKTSVFYDIKDELLRSGNYNVIVVDWTEYNRNLYPIACVNAVRTGLDVANMLQFLMKNTGITAESVHIIGHSLGAHVAGFAGKTIQNLGRISGIDAAGPIFQKLPNDLRLYHTDAIFVDAMHTNGELFPLKGYGTLYPYGHIDFFVNGGSTQPGCSSKDTFRSINKKVLYANTKFKKVSCKHDRSLFLFLESIRKCNFLSTLCNSYDSIQKGECLPEGECPSKESVTAKMGFHAHPIPSLPVKSTFFLRTRGNPPYCMNCDEKK